MGISAIRPRALEHWERNLGFGNRLEIQSAQLVKYVLYAARQACVLLDGNPFLLEGKLAKLEARIQFLQIDFREKLGQLREIREVLVRYRSLFDKAPIGFHNLTPDGIIVEVNDCWCRLLGYEREEVLGHSIFEFIVDGQVENATVRFNERLAGVAEEDLTPRNAVRQYRRKDGGIIYVETRDTVFRDDEGNLVMVQTSFQDITARVKAEEALTTAHEAMVQQEREAAVGHMAEAVSHVFKNQITIIAGLSWKLGQLLLRQRGLLESQDWMGLRSLEAEIEAVRQSIEECVKRMNATTRGFLTFSRTADEENTIIGLREEIEKYILPLTVIAEQKGARLTVSFHKIASDGGVLIAASSLQDVIRNLVINSIEAEAKVIRVIAAKTASRKIEICVQDDGCGIDPKLLPLLLHRPIKSVKPGGTGLGLSKVKRVVVSVGGDVFIRSRLGRGATVVITLPCVTYTPPASAVAPVDQTDPKAVSDITIMVVDDEACICEYFRDVLETLGYKVISFFDPIEALREYKGMAKKPQIVITDLTMPSLSGAELIEKIAEMSGRLLPQFAVCSGDPSIELPTHGIHQRMEPYNVVYIIKPVLVDPLREKIQELASRIQTPTPA